MDLSERSPKKAARIVRETLAGVKMLQGLAGRTFYAVGGTWRALARLHMRQRQYPMNVMHNYVIPTADALEFARLVERIEVDALMAIEAVSAARRPLLAYGAAVLEEIIRIAAPKEIVVSVLGVREGLLYSQLPPEIQAEDPLIVSAQRIQPPALARAGPRGGAVRLDDAPPRTRRISRRTTKTGACDTPPVFFPTFPGARIRIIAAPRPTTWSPTRPSSGSTIPPAPFSRSPPPIAISRTRISSRRSRARWSARASSTGRAFSARRCGSPTTSRPPCRAFCRARR